MENLFLHAVNELHGNVGYLLTSRYASHVLRVLLVVLSGLPLSRSDSRSLLQGRGKEKVVVPGADRGEGFALGERAVPQTFLDAVAQLSADACGSMDTSALRTLAAHPTGNPTLQLLIQIELTKFGKQRAKDENSIIRYLLPDDPITEDSDSGKFINGLVYDPVGSRLLETIVEFAPGKMFKSIYRTLFRDRMGSLARNEIAGYVVSKILQRLSKEDLQAALESILPQFDSLIERKRTAVIRTLIDRCAARGVDTKPIAAQLERSYSGSHGFDIFRLLKLGDISTEDNSASDRSNTLSQSDRLHGSLLAQSMVAVPGRLGDLVFDAFARLGESLSLKIAKDSTASRALQAALTADHATIIFRRKMIQQFYGHAAEMALDPSASHVIDAVWNGTQGLAFIRERIAEELAENEAALRESFVGRAVWKNWQMDLYKRRRADWVKKSRNTAGNDRFIGFPESGKASPQKSALELAREKHMAMKAKKDKDKEKAEKKSSKREKA
jgi:nucleolar protein 9